jgi:hypothetical protein
MGQISHGRWNVLEEHVDLIAIEHFDDAKRQPMTLDQHGLLFGDEEIERVIVHVEFDMALWDGADLLLKFHETVRRCDKNLSHG